ENDVKLRYVKNSQELNSPDLIIIPGTKNTISDLKYLETSGLAAGIISRVGSGSSTFLLGICGGYQMLGNKISDKHNLESDAREVDGLGLLPIRTRLATDKILSQVKARETTSGTEVSGYEIHHGLSACEGTPNPFFEIVERNGKKIKCPDGFRRKDGHVLGTYIHGLFDADSFRRAFLNKIRQSKGWQPLSQKKHFDQDGEFDKLAQLLRENLNMKALYGLVKVCSHGN
ncbi:MAG: cobyric acid synthase CobQ, partial [Candidatus Margulisiibacteriota bacterium]